MCFCKISQISHKQILQSQLFRLYLGRGFSFFDCGPSNMPPPPPPQFQLVRRGLTLTATRLTNEEKRKKGFRVLLEMGYYTNILLVILNSAFFCSLTIYLHYCIYKYNKMQINCYYRVIGSKLIRQFLYLGKMHNKLNPFLRIITTSYSC